MKKILLLGSGELGKEFVISAKRLGCHVIACDSYFSYADSAAELLARATDIGFPVVIKPVMSSSGKGQSVAQTAADVHASWDYACAGMRGDRQKVIVEEFIHFEFEITLLSQNLSEFDLHARAILGLPIPVIECAEGASAVVLADKEGTHPTFTGVEAALSEPGVDVRLFGKPTTRPYRRMAVALAKGPNALARAREAAGQIKVVV